MRGKRNNALQRNDFVAGTPEEPDGSGIFNDLIGYAQVKLVFDGGGHQRLPGHGHDVGSQRQDMVEGGVQDDGAHVWIVHGRPRRREATDAPAIDDDALRRELESVQCVLHDDVSGVHLLTRKRRALGRLAHERIINSGKLGSIL